MRRATGAVGGDTHGISVQLNNAECRKCGKREHYKVVCRSQTTQKAVGEVDEEVGGLFLGALDMSRGNIYTMDC